MTSNRRARRFRRWKIAASGLLFVLLCACSESGPSAPDPGDPGVDPDDPGAEPGDPAPTPVAGYGETTRFASHRYLAVGDTAHLGGYGEFLDSGNFGGAAALTVDSEVGIAECADGGAGWARFRFREVAGESPIQTLVVLCVDDVGSCAGAPALTVDLEAMRPNPDPHAANLAAAGSGDLFALCEPGTEVRLQQPVEMPPLMYRVVDAWGSGPYSIGGDERDWLRATEIIGYSGSAMSPPWLATIGREVSSIDLSADGSISATWDPCSSSPGCPVDGSWIQAGDYIIVAYGAPDLVSVIDGISEGDLRAFADVHVPGLWDEMAGLTTAGGDYDAREAMIFRLVGLLVMDQILADFEARYSLATRDIQIGIDPFWQTRQRLQCLPDQRAICDAAEARLDGFAATLIAEWKGRGLSPWWTGFVGYDPAGGFRDPARPSVELFDGAIGLLDVAALAEPGVDRPQALAAGVSAFGASLPSNLPVAMSVHWGPLEHVLEQGGFCEAEICPSAFSAYFEAFEPVVASMLTAFAPSQLVAFGLPMFDGAHFDFRSPYETVGGLELNRAGETGFNNPLLNLYYAQ